MQTSCLSPRDFCLSPGESTPFPRAVAAPHEEDLQYEYCARRRPVSDCEALVNERVNLKLMLDNVKAELGKHVPASLGTKAIKSEA